MSSDIDGLGYGIAKYHRHHQAIKNDIPMEEYTRQKNSTVNIKSTKAFPAIPRTYYILECDQIDDESFVKPANAK